MFNDKDLNDSVFIQPIEPIVYEEPFWHNSIA